MRKRTALSAAISGILCGAAMTPAGVAVAQDSDDYIEEIITTGSRIVRTDKFDTAGHVVAIDEQQIDALAQLNIADVLRSSPLNAYGSYSETSGSSWAGDAFFDLRGLGAQRTLVLVDGMRTPGSPNRGADAVNINLLPMVAIQRVDILADGASAVYGSDAVAGVVNLVMHKNFEGIQLSARYGDRENDDGGDQAISLLAGVGNDKGHVTFALEYSHRDPIFDADREYTAPWIRDTNGDGEIHAYTDTDGISYYGRSWELSDPVTGHYEWRAAADCPTTGGFQGVMGSEALGDPDGTLCTFAYAGVSANRAELKKINSYAYADYEATENVDLYARGLFSKNESFGRYAPPAAPWYSPPITHAHNPYDIAQMITDGTITDQYNLDATYRWTNIGTRDDNVDYTLWDLVVGAKGDVTDNVSFDFYVQEARTDTRQIGTYYLSYTGLDYVIANDIDPFSPLGAGAMRATTVVDAYTEQMKVYGNVQFDAGDFFAGGTAIALVGAEYVDLKYVNQYDAASEAGLVGGSAGNSSSGDRDFSAVFFEYLMPVTENSELNIAGRYDDYSDFGSNFSPSISYNINVTDTLSLRARWGEGFKAPALDQLYGPETFSADTAYDPVTDTRRQFDTFINTDPNLDAESSMSYSIGGNWEYLEGHSIDLAYWNVEVEDVITEPRAQSLLYADAAGVVFDPNGTRVERSPTGNVQAIYTWSTNSDKLEVNGIDLQLHSMFDTGWGMFQLDAFLSEQFEYMQNAYFKGGFQDTAGFFLQPTRRAQGSVMWNLSDHYVNWIIDYIGPHSEEDSIDQQTGVLTTSPNDLDSWTVMHLSYAYDADRFGQVKIGANNLLNEDPVLDIEGKYASDFSYLYDAIGRVYFIEYTLSFD